MNDRFLSRSTRASLGSRVGRAAAFALALGLCAPALPSVTAATPAQDASELEVIVTAYADVTGGNDPACPACDGEYGDADEAYALTRPLSPMRFEVLDGTGAVVGQATTGALGGLQTARIRVPAPEVDERYQVKLVEGPADWMLCFNDSDTRSFGFAEAGADGIRLSWYFYAGCERDLAPAPEPTLEAPIAVPPTVAPTESVAPPVPTTPTEEATEPVAQDEPAEPESREPVKQDRESSSAPRAAASVSHGSAPDAEGRLGSLRGRAFYDVDADGLRDADEHGMADVGVHLHGGGLQLTLITEAPGVYGFDALGAGEYALFVSPGPEWRVTTPARRVVRVAGDTQLDLDFGLTPDASSPNGSLPVGEVLPSLPATGGAPGSRPAAPLAAWVLAWPRWPCSAPSWRRGARRFAFEPGFETFAPGL